MEGDEWCCVANLSEVTRERDSAVMTHPGASFITVAYGQHLGPERRVRHDGGCTRIVMETEPGEVGDADVEVMVGEEFRPGGRNKC